MTARTLRDTWVITKRNLRRYVRLPQLLFFSSVQPVMFLLLFNYVFGGALGMSVQVPGGKYIDYLAFVRNQPVTMVVDAARQLALGIDGHGAVWKVLLWSVGLLIVFIPLAMLQYRRRGA